jgi:hypothetical protein
MAAADKRGTPGGGALAAGFGASGAFAGVFRSLPPQLQSERTSATQAEDGIRTGRASYQKARAPVAHLNMKRTSGREILP